MSKALTLALALAAGRAQTAKAAPETGESGLVVSALFGTEPPPFVHAAITNVLSFTLPSTKIVVHLSTASLVKPDSFTDQRISINPDRQHTSSATGMVTRQHASNVRYASQHLEFDHVVLFASTCRLLVGGGLLESTIRDFHFSAVMQPPWAQIALLPCDQQRKHPRLRKMGWCSSWLNIAKLFNGKSPKRQDYSGRMAFAMHEGSFFTKEAAVAFSEWLFSETGWGDPRIAAQTQFTAHSGVVGEELLWPTWTLSHAKQIGYAPKPGSSFCVHDGRFGSSDLSLAHSLVAYRLGVERRRRGCAPLMYAAKNRFGPDRIPRSSRFLHCLARVDSIQDQSIEDDQANVLTCIAQQPHAFLSGAALQRVGVGRKRIVDPGCALVHKGSGEPFGDGDKVIDVAVAVVRYLARRAHQPEPSFAAAAAALRARNASGFAYGFGTNSTKKTKRLHNATAIRKKVPWYRRHGHANATLARRHRGNATGFLRHRRHANATHLRHRRHPRRHNPDGLGAPIPGSAVDGVGVAAPAPQGISSELEALAVLHRKGALTDGEFAAAKAKLLG